MVERKPTLFRQLPDRESAPESRVVELLVNPFFAHVEWCIVCTKVDQDWCTLSNAIPPTVEEMREKGHAIPIVGDWWLRLARSLLTNDPRDLRTLGRELAKAVGRKKPFPHTSLSRFATGVLNPQTGAPYPVTYELINALCAEFSRLPPPIAFARSYEEAVHMQGVAERYDRISVEETPPATVVPIPKSDDRRRRGKKPAVVPATLPVSGRRRARG